MHHFDWQKKVSLRPGLLLLGLLLGTVVLPLAAAQEAGASAEVETATPEHAKINTADATPVDPGQWEVEWSYDLGRAKRSWSGGGHSQVRPLLREQTLGLAVTAGVVDNLDVSVGGGYLWLKDRDVDDSMAATSDDMADFGLAARYRFLSDPALGLDLAYSAGLTIPADTDTSIGRICLSQQFWSLDQQLIASRDWGEWTANTALGYSLPLGNRRESARGMFTADAALGYQLRPWLQSEIEVNYCSYFFQEEENGQQLAVTGGLVMPVNETWRVNLGVQQGVWGRHADKMTSLLAAIKVAF